MRDMEDPSLNALIERSALVANDRGVRGTPGLPRHLIGDDMIRGALPPEQFRAAVVNARVAPEGGRKRSTGRRAEEECRKVRGIRAALTEVGSASSEPHRDRGRGPRPVVPGYDRAGSTIMRPRPRRSR